jgi:hypothetical protein
MAMSSTNGKNAAAITSTPHATCIQSSGGFSGGRPRMISSIERCQFETASPVESSAA